MKSVMNAIETIYNAPKDWTPDGGLLWLTIMVVVAVGSSIIFFSFEKELR